MQVTGGRAALGQTSWEPLLALPSDHYLRQFVVGFMALLSGDRAAARAAIEGGIAANRENAPLNADMHGVLARLAEAEAGASADATEPAVAPVAAEAEAAADAHFLLGAYRRQ
jgi:hypothetical protein